MSSAAALPVMLLLPQQPRSTAELQSELARAVGLPKAEERQRAATELARTAAPVGPRRRRHRGRRMPAVAGGRGSGRHVPIRNLQGSKDDPPTTDSGKCCCIARWRC